MNFFSMNPNFKIILFSFFLRGGGGGEATLCEFIK